MKVELHLHTSRYSACSQNTPAAMMERLIQTGYDAVFITEHNAVWSDEEIAQLQSGYPEIKIFPGVELSTGVDGSQHILVLGTTDSEYLKLRSAEQILQKSRQDGCLSVLAHPFRWAGGAEILKSKILPDAIEYYSGNHKHPEAEMTLELSKRLNLPIVNTGDVHGLADINQFWIETHYPIESASDIRKIILERAYDNCVFG